MNWFKKKIDKFLNREDMDYDEYYEEYEELPNQPEPLNETPQASKQKTFRFPLIDDGEEMLSASQSKDMFNQMDDTYSQIEDLSLPKHLDHRMADSRVYDIEVSGIRELLENRSKRTGRTTTTRSQPKQEYPTKASMVFRDAQVEAQPKPQPKSVQKEPVVKQESKTEDLLQQNRKRFVPTDVPSPVYGFAKPSPIEQLLNKRKEEHEAETPSMTAFTKEATTNDTIENILEEKEPIKAPNDVREQLEIQPTSEAVWKQSSVIAEVAITEESPTTAEAKQLISFDDVDSTEHNQLTEKVSVEVSPKQPITFEEVEVDEQSSMSGEDKMELPIPQTTSFAVNFEEQIKEAVQQELAVEQLSADQSEIHVKEVVVEQLQIENSTIHIGEVTVVQPTNDEEQQAIVEESSVKQEKSRIPFNVLMLKTDKEKWRIAQQLKSLNLATAEEPQRDTAFSSNDFEADASAEVVEVEKTSEISTSTEVETEGISVITMSPVATMTTLPTFENAASDEIAATVVLENELSQEESPAIKVEAVEEASSTTAVENALPQEESPAIKVEAVEEASSTTAVENTLSQEESPAIKVETIEEASSTTVVDNTLSQEESPAIKIETTEKVSSTTIVENSLPQEESPAIKVEAVEEASSIMVVDNTLSQENLAINDEVVEESAATMYNNVPLVQHSEETIAIQFDDEKSIGVEGHSTNVLPIADGDEHLESEIKPVKPVHVYQKPTDEFLEPPEEKTQDTEWMEQQGDTLVEALSYFQVSAQIESIMQGPAVTQFEITVSHGTKVSKIRNLADDLKLALAAKDIRIQAPIPGKSSIGIEIPNRVSRAVRLSEVTNSASFLESDSPLEAALGLDLTGKPVTIDLRKMPHGLIAGATGSGKSVCINSILVSLLYKAAPHELKLMLIDPKMVELAPFNHIPHLVSPVITDVKAATAALKWAVEEMERRYQLFAHAGARDITRYNALADKNNEHSLKLPYILIVIDELADLMMMSPADVEEAICRIAQKARACGIHLIVATQRPSVDVITGLIKSNIPTRIAFAVSSQIDSRTILDGQGAERLLGRGDMLYLGNGMSAPVRLQGTFVTDDEIEAIIDHVREQGEPDYIFDQEELLKKSEVTAEQDDLFEDVCRFVYEAGGASTSLIQRKYHIGYNRAARLIDMLESHGFVSEARGSKPRESYITEQDLIAMFE
ncbi:DNA translocase FtsK [Lysinibacillus sp. NPDC097195]|uniref:DNA translocase FtsK n=1 Tax=Lysinibacillus sp. NPDC097195 TaxID=3364141 RepID=UPI003824F933